MKTPVAAHQYSKTHTNVRASALENMVSISHTTWIDGNWLLCSTGDAQRWYYNVNKQRTDQELTSCTVQEMSNSLLISLAKARMQIFLGMVPSLSYAFQLSSHSKTAAGDENIFLVKPHSLGSGLNNKQSPTAAVN